MNKAPDDWVFASPAARVAILLGEGSLRRALQQIKQPVSYLDAAAFFSDVVPDVIEFGFALRYNARAISGEMIARRLGGADHVVSPRRPVAAWIPA
jgi:hypothetical protein